jgi:hypothetical protein
MTSSGLPSSALKDQKVVSVIIVRKDIFMPVEKGALLAAAVPH